MLRTFRCLKNGFYFGIMLSIIENVANHFFFCITMNTIVEPDLIVAKEHYIDLVDGCDQIDDEVPTVVVVNVSFNVYYEPVIISL